ncbi:MAG: hypothetical protein RL088_4233 [Verrucomicrobiota bacterium]|jgi:serine/threonine protein kinase/regulation of enolase protein 1 (concanavalin A-like superfamily)
MPATQTENCPACGTSLDVTGAQIFAERTCPVCGTPINVRRKFGHYELMEVLGHGGQGLVFKAVDNNLNRLVALKLLRTEYAEDPEFVRQFESEAQVTASINHPNVVRVFSFGADEGHVYLAMEMVANGTLDDLMEKRGRLPEARVLEIGIQIANGLKAGYERGLVHRDVKPGNILFGEDGSAKIVDFGLALFLEQEAANSGEIWGTPYYLSPERLNRVPEDFRSDIYSLGATLFHAIAGRPPFEAPDATGVALKHLKANAVSIQAWAPDVTNSTAFVINRTLSKNPDDRYASYDEFIEQLQFAREEAQKQASGGSKKEKSRVVLEDSGSRKVNSIVTIATLVVLVGGVGIGGWLIAKALKKEVPPGIETASLESFGPEWTAARDLLVQGNVAPAIEAYRALAEKSKGDKRSWALVFQALAHQLAGNSQAAASTLASLERDTAIGRFFVEFAPVAGSTASVTANSADRFSRTNHESLATLFLAIKAYHDGNVAAAAPLFRQFTTTNHERDFAFLSEFKKVAKPFEDDLTGFDMVNSAAKTARNSAERAAGLAALREFQTKLKPGSSLAPAVKEAIAKAEKLTQEDEEARRKSNFAASAKVTVSGANTEKDDKPEYANDGKLDTRWYASGPGDKWIQFDLGAEKQIGRWAVRLVPKPAIQNPNRLRDFRLEYGNDGSTWTIADTVFGNRSDTCDRLVKPFSARYARIVITRGSWNLKDNNARLYEVELSAPISPEKAGYGLGESVAIRFSPDSPLSIQHVGPMSVLPVATFDPKAGKYTIKGGGEDIWALADSFHFANQAVQGDFEMVVRVTNVQGPHPWSKAGIMIRTDYTKESTHAMLAIGPGGKAQFVSRKEPAKQSISVEVPNRKPPLWLKLVRTGGTITGFESQDGQKWTKVGEEIPANLGAIVHAGIVVCAHQAGVLATGEFDNFLITPAR